MSLISTGARVVVEVDGAEPVVLEGATVEQTSSHYLGRPATAYVIIRASVPGDDLPFPVQPARPEGG